MSQIYDRLYKQDEIPVQPDTENWQQPWRILPEHDSRQLPGEVHMRAIPRPLARTSLTSRLKSLFK